jgi:hypothetical protein
MPGFPFVDAAVQQLSAMQQLRSVTFKHTGSTPGGTQLQVLPNSITQLQLQCANARPDLPLGLPQLSQLLHLALQDCAVPPTLLGTVTQLQALHLVGCWLLPCGEDDYWDTAGTDALLGLLPSLTGLQDLRLSVPRLDPVSIGTQRFSALTSSSCLTRLTLTKHSHDAVIPLDAVQHMFPPGRQMQRLQHLTISNTISTEVGEWTWCIYTADIVWILRACPQLHWLDISGSVEPGGELGMFLKLPQSCTSLLVGGEAFTDAAVPILWQLTQLRHLSWARSPDFTDFGLGQLVGLDFHELFVGDCGISQAVCWGGRGTIKLWTHSCYVSCVA